MKVFNSFFLKGGLLFVLLIANGCNKELCKWSPKPGDAAYFIVQEDGKTIIDTNFLYKISLYYYNNLGVKIKQPNDIKSQVQYDVNSFIVPFKSFDNQTKDSFEKGIMIINPLISTISINQAVHKFYLQFPNGDVDTLFLKAEKVSCEQGWKERCQCEMPIRVLKFNGQAAKENTDYHLSNNQPVYVFNKSH